MQVDNERPVFTPASNYSSWPISSSRNVLKFPHFIIKSFQPWKEYYPKVLYSLLFFIFLTTHCQLHQYTHPCSITKLAYQSELAFFPNCVSFIYYSLQLNLHSTPPLNFMILGLIFTKISVMPLVFLFLIQLQSILQIIFSNLSILSSIQLSHIAMLQLSSKSYIISRKISGLISLEGNQCYIPYVQFNIFQNSSVILCLIFCSSLSYSFFPLELLHTLLVCLVNLSLLYYKIFPF